MVIISWQPGTAVGEKILPERVSGSYKTPLHGLLDLCTISNITQNKYQETGVVYTRVYGEKNPPTSSLAEDYNQVSAAKFSV